MDRRSGIPERLSASIVGNDFNSAAVRCCGNVKPGLDGLERRARSIGGCGWLDDRQSLNKIRTGSDSDQPSRQLMKPRKDEARHLCKLVIELSAGRYRSQY